jgi:hypothetical protein
MPAWVLRFENASLDEANVLAADLRQAIREAAPEVSVEVKRDSATAQDVGGSLALILGTPAALILAKAVLAWARSNNRASINLYTAEGVLEARGLESKDVPELVKAFSGSK